MTILEGHYFNGYHPVALEAKMDFWDQEVALAAGSILGRYWVSELRVSPRIGSSDRFIAFPDGGQFVCADAALLDSLRQESQAEGVVAWLEERWIIALSSVVIIFCALLAGYFFGLPAAARAVAEGIPVETERALGAQAVTWLDEKGW
ncbi:MAG: hypothetical protein SWE60_13450, partial [Thermodesulfobacteriota bacterium]|nr:hypothetical protein [Thermodesulfobacteriota bacterium]